MVIWSVVVAVLILVLVLIPASEIILVIRIVSSIFSEVVEVDGQSLALYGLALEAQSRLRISVDCRIVKIIVCHYLILYLFRLELEEAFHG